MLRCRAVVVTAMAATVLPSVPVYAAEIPALSLPPTPPAPAIQLFAPSQAATAPGLRPGSQPVGLQFEKDVALSSSRPGDPRQGLVSGAAPGSSLKITPAISASRTGWAFSGRLGPVRWLTPLEGEGETKMRFGGRLPGQPRLPGTSTLINFGFHYTFE